MKKKKKDKMFGSFSLNCDSIMEAKVFQEHLNLAFYLRYCSLARQ